MDGIRSVTEERQNWIGLCARARNGRLVELLADVGRPDFTWLRAPDTGSVMVRGRAGATGAPFNLAEMTVTRATLRLSDGTIGHGWVQGRDRGACEAAALVDAMMQTREAARVQTTVLRVLAEEAETRQRQRAGKAAATKVEFFTLVRGEDQ